MNKALHKFNHGFDLIITYCLILSIGGMLVLTLSNITLRWFNQTWSWADPLVRHLVFLSAFLGGTLAMNKRKHISIDLLGIYLRSKKNKSISRKINFVIDLVTAFIIIYLLYACIEFVKSEAQYGKMVFLGVHSKYLVGIIPMGFSLMLIRLLTEAFERFTEVEVEV